MLKIDRCPHYPISRNDIYPNQTESKEPTKAFAECAFSENLCFLSVYVRTQRENKKEIVASKREKKGYKPAKPYVGVIDVLSL